MVRGKRGHLSPPEGKFSVFFVDDLNLSATDRVSARDVLRSYFSYKGWYLKKEKQFVSVKNVGFITCDSFSRKHRSDHTLDVLDGNLILNLKEISEQDMSKIFTTISRSVGPFS